MIIKSLFLISHLLMAYSLAATIDIRNNCPFILWPASVPGGGRRLDRGERWTINVPSPTIGGSRVWARTNCKFDSSGKGRCQTGDCNGLLDCKDYGQSPVTLAEFSLGEFNGRDFFDLSVVDGFNVPMEFRPSNSSDGCTRSSIMCAEDLNGQCPDKLRAPGGCNNPCRVFQTSEYCCNNSTSRCSQTTYSRFFRDRCPDAYSFSLDDDSSLTFTCPVGTNYSVIFCP